MINSNFKILIVPNSLKVTIYIIKSFAQSFSYWY